MIRKATLKDCPELGQLNKQLIEDEQHPNQMNVKELTVRMKEWISSDYSCYLHYKKNSIDGYALFREETDCYYLRHLFTRRDLRCKGIATELLDWLHEHLWKEKKVQLEVLSHNTSAIKFYENYGFKIDCLRMEK